MVQSVLARHDAVTVHFLSGQSVPAEDVQRLRDMVVQFGGNFVAHHIADEQVSGLPVIGHVSKAMWYRIWLPDLVPESRVLYLDCDTLVVDDLTPLRSIDLTGYYLAAADVPLLREGDWRVRLDVPDGGDYFNSGVLLLNLDAMRADDVSARIAAFGRERAALLKWPDQDALNAVLGHRRLRLHPRWNCQNRLFDPRDDGTVTFTADEARDATTNPAIVHFEGPGDNKPWHFLNTHPWGQAYREAMAATPWRDAPLLGHNWQNRLIAGALPKRWQLPVFARLEAYKHRLGLRSELTPNPADRGQRV